MKLQPFPKCGQLMSIPYHKVLKNLKKTNAQYLFLIGNIFFSFLFFGIATLSPCVCNAKYFPTKVDEIITFQLDVKKFDSKPAFVSISFAKLQFRISTKVSRFDFLLVGYMGCCSLFGTISKCNKKVPLVDQPNLARI